MFKKNKKEETEKRTYAIYEEEPEEIISESDSLPTEKLENKTEEKIAEAKQKEKKEPDGEKPKRNNAIILVVCFMVLILLLTVGTIGFSLAKNGDIGNNGGSGGNSSTDVIKPSDNIDLDKLFSSGSKIYAPDGAPGTYDINKSLSTVGEISSGILRYYEELTESEMAYLNGKLDEDHFKADLSVMKEGVKTDIDLLASYKLMYKNLKGEELYEVTMKRYMNFLSTVEAIKPNMKREKMIETTNRYIEIEQSYSNTAREALKQTLTTNGIKYTEKNNSIQYDIPADLLKPNPEDKTDATDYEGK